jgi:hypothetical protein
MFGSFGHVFSRSLGVRHVGIVMGRLAFLFDENPLVFDWGLGDGPCGLVWGLHTHTSD